LVEAVDIVISIVGMPSDVEEIYLDEDGIIAHAKANQILIDMTTSSPELATKIYDRAKLKAISVLDAPVTGGEIGAINGGLTIMVGGDEASFNQCEAIFNVMGANVFYFGKAGLGQHCKLANQIGIAGAMAGLTELLVYAKSNGLDTDLVLKAVSGGSAGS